MLKTFLPQSPTSADITELLDGEITQHGHAAELVGAGARCVGVKLAVGNGYESSLSGHLQCSAVVTSTGTGEVFGGVPQYFLDFEFGVRISSFHPRLWKMEEIGLLH